MFINCFIIWFRDRLIQTLKMQVKTKHIEKRKMSLDYGNGDYQSLYIGNFQCILGPRWKISTVKFASKVTCRFIQLHAFTFFFYRKLNSANQRARNHIMALIFDPVYFRDNRLESCALCIYNTSTFYRTTLTL